VLSVLQWYKWFISTNLREMHHRQKQPEPNKAPLYVPYEPTKIMPCFELRSRRELNTFDAVNTRLVNHWQTDAPQIQVARQDLSGAIFHMDMNPTPSRLYRENILQSQPFVVPSASASAKEKNTIKLGDQINQRLSTIQGLKYQYQTSIKDIPYSQLLQGNIGNVSKNISTAITKQENEYKYLLAQQKLLQVDTLSDNPYFDKYDVASDSRNIVRELRGTVSEDIRDRGVRESQLLLRREMDSRWVPQGYAQDKGLDSLSAFELMRPKITDMNKDYHR
jgi:hypothetical protein